MYVKIALRAYTQCLKYILYTLMVFIYFFHPGFVWYAQDHPFDVPVILVGNKVDQQYDRMVTYAEGRKRCQELGCVAFHEISVREDVDQVGGKHFAHFGTRNPDAAYFERVYLFIYYTGLRGVQRSVHVLEIDV